jgi:hypothetical protein
MGWLKTERVAFDVEARSNLDLILRATNGIGNRLVDALNGIGAGLRAIALALSTSQDNQAAVQAEIDRLTAQLNTSTAEVKSAIDQTQKRG